MGYFRSTKSYFRIQFEPNNFRFFYQINDDEGMKEFVTKIWKDYDDADKYIFSNNPNEQQNFSFYNGNKMFQKNQVKNSLKLFIKNFFYYNYS